MHIITLFFINTDTDTTFWHRYKIEPYCWYTHEIIVPMEAALSWKAKTCNEEHGPSPATTACVVMVCIVTTMATSTELVRLECSECSVPLQNVIILLEYTGRGIFQDVSTDKNIILRASFWYLVPVKCGTSPWIISCTGIYSYKIWGLWCQNQLSRACINNNFPQ